MYMITQISNYELVEVDDLIFSIVRAQHDSGNQSYAFVHGLSEQGIQRVRHVQNDADNQVDFLDTQFFIPSEIPNTMGTNQEPIPVKGIEPYALSAHQGIDLHGLYILAEHVEYIGKSAFENANIEYIGLNFGQPVKIDERAFYGNENMTISTTAETLKQFNPVNDRSFAKLDDLNKLSLEDIFDEALAFRLSFAEELENEAIDKNVKIQKEIEKKFKNSYDVNEAEDAAKFILDDKVPDFEELDLND